MGAVRARFSPPELDDHSLQLVQAHVFFRHGDRSPTPILGAADPERWVNRLEEVPPLMALRQYQSQPKPFGHLTTKGAEQARELGVWIRDAYLSGLDVDLNQPNSYIKVRSTNYLRTHMSAWFVLEGLLGSPESASSVPVVIRDERVENLYHNDHCPRLAKLWRAAWMSTRKTQQLPDGAIEELGWYSEYEDVRKSFMKHLNWHEGRRFPWVLAADFAQCALSHGDPLPESLTEETLSEIRNFLASDYASTFQDKEICELSMGRLMREVVDAMRQQSESEAPSVYLYSGHDATIVPLSVALGRPWKGWPPYAASISVELWRCVNDREEKFVRVMYDGSEVELPVDCEGGVRGLVEDEPPSDSTHSKQTIYTIQQFVNLVEWTMLSEAEFQNKCQCDFGLDELSFQP